MPDTHEALITYIGEWEAKINAFTEARFTEAAYSGADGSGYFAPGYAAPAGNEPELPAEAKSLVADFPFAVNDNIAIRDFLFTCGSKHLAAFRSPFDAGAVLKLLSRGAFVIGKTNIDEFGMGSSTENSGIQKTCNPWDVTRVPGGASGGAAAAVAAGIVPFALGSCAEGSTRQSAALCGVTGLKPTCGAVSRHGLSACASSMDGIGILADSAARARAVFAAVRGKDPKDSRSKDAPAGAPELYAAKSTARGATGTIGVLSGEAITKLLEGKATMEPEVLRGFNLAKERFAGLGFRLVEADIPGLKYALPAYYAIVAAETASNMARFDGIRIGARPDFAENHDDLVDKARGMGFGDNVKLMILLGTYALHSGRKDEYYFQAQKIRAGIIAGLEALLGNARGGDGARGGAARDIPPKMDAILLPVFPARAFARGAFSVFEQKTMNVFNCAANLAGLPAVSFPASLEGGLPVGAQLMGRAFSEGPLLDMAEAYETAYPFPRPRGFRAFWRPAPEEG